MFCRAIVVDAGAVPSKSASVTVTIATPEAPAVVEELSRRGHEVVLAPAGTLGKMTAVTTENGVLRAAADLRASEPYAAGR